ncbi:MarR family transcriptional regulator [Mucilaginibacter rubeus]|uniref:MarR family transcriptional regulator n=1 Tax=Mucilaginibacter rubeus TaxID=2027860 RepID=A0AAE6MHU8_9SPHI|nr:MULTISPECIES: MarR family winged helix-turn-helix transcriptional regulator [Mucilaginibacter]QEM04010.1 MarR family transcriptional regulator [Mucilaginibacter rubeus]QEM16616.1 MarR family transcriptional regulator [Mucilaginibacter gossypii]QTE38429.1 MarR family winged helix-turn-helix transcriptional regulator [Mucilaginibacter gossypii]QTE40605.1 MarR family transcriptional regulator [Mucilaginibacter rubeus]QTE47207.1 MarR family transcriptional regulator [Mucilaginibacter rubeus]
MKPIVQLVDEWTAFEEVSEQPTVEAFCRYYLQKQRPKPKQAGKKGERIMNGAYLLKTLGRILSAYSLYFRSAVNHIGIPPAESFYYLNGLLHLGEVRKSDLINYMFAETTTGMEVINRLIRENKIDERTSPDDKRAKLIKITEKGITALDEYYKISGKVVEMTFKGIDDDILTDCYEMLKYCEQRNSAVAIELKNKPFDQMYELAMADKA